MDYSNVIRLRICPRCGKPYRGYPKFSRRENKACICPECRTREALEYMNIAPDEIERIISVQKKYHVYEHEEWLR